MGIDALDAITIVVVVFNIVVICPILVYYLVLYRRYEQEIRNEKNKDQDVINIILQRNALLIYSINVLAIVSLPTERVYMAAAHIWGNIVVPEWTVWFGFAVFWCAIMYLFAIKVWLLHYEQRYNIAIVERVWKKDITDRSDWYVDNKKKYGNVKYLIKFASVPYLITIIFAVATASLLDKDDSVLDIFHLSLSFIPISVAVFALWKVRHLNDIYKLRNEIFYQVIILLVALFIQIFDFGLFEIARTDFTKRLEAMSFLIVTDCVAVSLALGSTAYPIYISKRLREKNEKMLTSSFISSHKSHYATGIQGINQILSDYNLFKQFMSYLVYEFCAENVLFLVELIQVKNDYSVRNNQLIRIPKMNLITSTYGDAIHCNWDNINPTEAKEEEEEEEEEPNANHENRKSMAALHGNSNSTAMKQDNELYQVVDFNVNPLDTYPETTIFTYLFRNEGSIMTQIHLTTEIPTCSILERNKDDLFMQMRALYRKYVKTNSAHELNISYDTRRGLMDYFESIRNPKKVRDYKLFTIMDECAIEIIQLLHAPFGRFTRSEAFKVTVSRSEMSYSDRSDDSKRAVMPRSRNQQRLPDPNKLPVLRHASSFAALQQKYHIKSKMNVAMEVILAAAAGDVSGLKHITLEANFLEQVKDYDLRTPLHLAASNGHLKFVKYLFAMCENLDVNCCDRWGGTPLDDAIREGHLSVVTYLKEMGGVGRADYSRSRTDETGMNVILHASTGDLTALRKMHLNAMDVDVKDYDFRTPLHLSVSNGHLKVVKFLFEINGKLDVNCCDRWGGTPLDDAIREGHLKIITFLKERGGVAQRSLPFKV